MKKTLAILLTLIMLLSCMSVPALATEPVETALITDSELQGITAHTDTGLKLIGSKEAVYGTDYTITTNGNTTNGKSMCYVNILTSGWKIAGTVSDAFADIYMDIRIENDNEVEGFTVTVGDLSKEIAENLISLTVNLSNSKDVTIALDTTKALWLDMLTVGSSETNEVKIVGNGKEIDTSYLTIMANVCLDNVTVKAESATSFAALCMGELSLTNGAKLIAISTADSYAYGLYGMGTSVSASADSEIFLSGKDGAVCGFSAADLAFIEGWKASADVVAYADKGTMTAVATDAEVGEAFLSTIKGAESVTVAKTVYNETAPATSGSTDITAIREVQPVAYEIVIPNAVTMTKAGVVEIGAATIKTDKLKNATANTVISYTASGTDFALSTNASKTVPATYYTAYTDENTNTVLGTAPIVVYQNNALVDPLTTLHVGVSEADWNAAVPGTYTATVTFDFAAEEKVPGDFKAVHDTNGGVNTLTFYYDKEDHSGAGKTVYQNGTENYLFDDTKAKEKKWGYYALEDWSNPLVKSVVIDESVKNYHGLTSTAYMFNELVYATDITGTEYLDVSHVTNMSYMFYEFGYEIEGDVGVPNVANWNTSNVTDMSGLFYDYAASSLTINAVPDVSGWNTANVTNMECLFSCYNGYSEALSVVPDVSGWKTDKVTNMADVFCCYGADSLVLNAVPDVSGWNTANVTTLSDAFEGYGDESPILTAVPDVSGWNTDKVTNLKGIFELYGSKSTVLTDVPDVSGWNTANVTNMKQAFHRYGAASTVLNAVPDVENWKTDKVTKVSLMFRDYGKASTALDFVLDLSGWDLSNVDTTSADNYKHMFGNYGEDDEYNTPKDFVGKSWSVTIPAATGEKDNDASNWYVGSGTPSVAPAKDKSFTVAE